MQMHTRRAVAFIAGRLITGRSTTAIFDHEQGSWHEFSGEADDRQVCLFDHTEATSLTGKLPELYHHSNKSSLRLDIQGGSFAGRDEHSGFRFAGSVSGSSIALFDEETQKHYLFVI